MYAVSQVLDLQNVGWVPGCWRPKYRLRSGGVRHRTVRPYSSSPIVPIIPLESRFCNQGFQALSDRWLAHLVPLILVSHNPSVYLHSLLDCRNQ